MTHHTGAKCLREGQEMKAPTLTDPPWGAHDAEAISVLGTLTGTIEESDVAEWLAYGSPSTWQQEACVVRLKDGRIVAWVTSWDVTGSGFHADAYGGDAVLVFGPSVEAVMPYVPEQDRELLKWGEP
jgi:hypothetical protein